MRKVLITGSSGFVGRHTIEPLRELGFEVLRPSSGELNLLSQEHLESYLQKNKPTHLLHLAWLTQPGIFFESADNIRWVEATLSLARIFSENGGRRFVGVGTCFEALTQRTFYGECKRHTNELLQVYSQRIGMSFAWARLFFLYGPHEKPERLVPQVITGLLRGEPVKCSSGEQIRDYLYVQDCADMLANLTDNTECGTLEIASGSPCKLRDLISICSEMLGKSYLIRLGALPDRVGEQKTIMPENKILWQPKVSLEEGIAKTIAYWSK